MKILILANFGLGLYKFRKELLQTLINNNDEVFVSFPFDSYTEKIKELGCTYLETEFNRKGKNPINDIKLFNHYRKMIRKIRPDVVLTYTIKPTVYGGLACQLERAPYIVNITGVSIVFEEGGLLGVIATILYKIGLRKADKVFFQNKDNCDLMVKKGIVKSAYEIIPGSGVNLNQYKPVDFPEDDKTGFAYIGRITKSKGIEYYLDAAEYIHKKYPETEFHVCGSYDEDDLKSRIDRMNEEGIIVYDGIVDVMEDIYKRIQCTVLPTFYAEGMSNVLLESLASGRPIITTDRTGCKEIVDDGVNGYVVKQKNLQDLIEKIEMFLSLTVEQRKQLGMNGRRKVEKEFDRDIVVNKYIQEIDRLRK